MENEKRNLTQQAFKRIEYGSKHKPIILTKELYSIAQKAMEEEKNELSAIFVSPMTLSSFMATEGKRKNNIFKNVEIIGASPRHAVITVSNKCIAHKFTAILGLNKRERSAIASAMIASDQSGKSLDSLRGEGIIVVLRRNIL